MNLVSLFDESGNMLRPWAWAGHQCYCFDILNKGSVEYFGDGVIHYIHADLSDEAILNEILALDPKFISSFAPCTDLASSGAKHFELKELLDPQVFDKALNLVLMAERLANMCGAPWMLENPKGRISTLYRPPDHFFHPYEYSGYLPLDDVHPRYPDFIAPRDMYPKETFIWCGNGFVMPPKKFSEIPIGYSAQQKSLGGKSSKTKRIRAETPRGFALAVFESNEPLLSL
jgi:hypothetical protein